MNPPSEFAQPSLDLFDDVALDDEGNPTYSVSELAELINDQLRRGLGDGVWVRGEIDGFRSSGPHRYFSLVEQGDDGKAVINVSLFAPMLKRLTPLLARNQLQLTNGMKVRIFGHLDYYAPNGRLGLKMSGIDPRFTLGELSMARDQVVRRLIASGLFDANRRRDLPLVPLTVGVVTSVGTAAWHDFHDELDSSRFGFKLIVCDTRVQGDGASASVAAALSTVSRRPDVDVVAVIRGGGARNELAVFDDEAIAVAIGTSPVPVLTGIGHEIDRSVADEVAHMALKTPTAVAGVLIDRVREFRSELEVRWTAIQNGADRNLMHADGRLRERADAANRSTGAAIGRAGERLARRREVVGRVTGRLAAEHDRLERHSVALTNIATRRLDTARSHLDRGADRLVVRAPIAIGHAERSLAAARSRVALADPINLLRRGWSVSRGEDGRVLRSIDEVDVGAVVVTTLADGTFSARVDETASPPGGFGRPQPDRQRLADT